MCVACFVFRFFVFMILFLTYTYPNQTLSVHRFGENEIGKKVVPHINSWTWQSHSIASHSMPLLAAWPRNICGYSVRIVECPTIVRILVLENFKVCAQFFDLSCSVHFSQSHITLHTYTVLVYTSNRIEQDPLNYEFCYHLILVFM